MYRYGLPRLRYGRRFASTLLCFLIFIIDKYIIGISSCCFINSSLEESLDNGKILYFLSGAVWVKCGVLFRLVIRFILFILLGREEEEEKEEQVEKNKNK